MMNLFRIGLLLISMSCAGQTPVRLSIQHLTGDVYVFTTWNTYKGNRIPANGLYIVGTKGAVMIDTPWDTTQFQPLLDSIQRKHHQKVVVVISTHFHEDRTGGLTFYRNQGIQTFTTLQTDQISALKGMPRAQYRMKQDTTFRIGSATVATFYPGPGHAPDNIVVWLPTEKVLYGGCLIKSTADSNLGNLGDANTAEYAGSVRRVIQKYPSPRYVIPGHQSWESTKSLQHTLRMAEELLSK